MTAFFLLAAVLVLASLALLLVGPIRARAASERDSDLRATNISLAREQRAQLAQALSSGAIDASTHDEELAQLERSLATELAGLPVRKDRDGSIPAIVLVAAFVPITAGALYLHLGDPGAITRAPSEAQREPRDADISTAQASAERAAGAPAATIDGQQAPALSELLPRLEERLAREPDDVDGWRLLGRTYLGIDEFGRAESAFRRALALDGADIPTLGQLAEAIAMARGGDLSGEPTELIDRVLGMVPDDPQSLWLRAIAHQQTGEHETALAMFARLRNGITDDPNALTTIDAMMARSLAVTGGDASVPSASNAPATKGVESAAIAASEASAGDGAPRADAASARSSSAAASDTDIARVAVTIDLSAEARADAQPGEVVFVYARASQGPPMPLAVARYAVADLPVAVTLDESMAMMPTMSLASFPSVTVGARISKTGNAIGESGDWFAEQEDVSVGADTAVSLVINRQRP